MTNQTGALLMVLAMAGFALEDMVIKLMAGSLPVGQILLIVGAGGALVFSAILRARGQRVLTADILSPAVVARNVSEIVGTCGYVLALALIPISLASTILQAVPLIVTLASALLLGERVGWRRWAAIGVGFLGVLLVLRPGMEGFRPESLLALLGAVGLAARDVAARRVPARVSSMHLSTWAFAALVPLGAVLLWVEGGPVTMAPLDIMRAAFVIATGVVAYWLIVAASRAGDVSFVAPFRYTRILFALAVGYVVFAERPDALTLVGAAIIVGSGVYTLWREARVRRASPKDAAAL
ncbi:DMT family transporter [Wenxinia marina]|uniref:Permease of the drug/metabolite transporter (DMT) superfamily n=1 Tax=Wenxinia marina DSM 24838 TaxID=1123501 RepID=A0A0D0Q2M6_9RHOB|nr:DMT family transporter [Wenxinia marina]KIQ68784.1 Permease of the drug/metabolite transporter (DMT) superfamily [Wenxinia marina DSM 24838]GGL65202.1 membrane protein [Wenxinia marina]